MIGITSTAKGKGLNKSPKTALSPTFQPPHLPSPCRANTKPPSPIGTSRSSHLSPETNTKTQNQLIYRNLKEYRCKPQNSPVWLVQGAAIYINIAAPCTTEIHTENQHFTLRVKPRVQPRFLHRLLILCFSCNPVIPKNKKSPKHFPFSVKIPIFASVPRAERSNAAKPAQLPNRYRLPNFLLFKSYLPTDYKKTIVFSQKLIDVIIPDKDYKRLWLGLVLVSFLLLARLGLGTIRQYMLFLQSRDFNNRLIAFFYNHLLRLPKFFFDTRRIGELVARLNDTRRIQSVVSIIAGSIVIDFLVTIVTLSMLFYYSWPIALLLVISIPLFIWIVSIYNAPLVEAQRNVMMSYAHSESNFINTMQGIDTIKNFNRQHEFGALNQAIYGFFQNKVFDLGRLNIKLSVVYGIISIVLIVGAIGIGSFFVLSGRLKLGELMAAISLVASIAPAIVNLALVSVSLNEAKVAFNRMFEFVGIPSEKKEGDFSPGRVDSIQVKNISFRFPGRKRILDNISLAAFKDKMIFIIGESGCGKSTFCKIMERAYELETGEILLNGKDDLRGTAIEKWRENIGVVPQDVFIFNGTVMDNLLLSGVDTSPQYIIDVCSRYGVDKYIARLPQGYHTVVGEEGINLSGGQKQLIAFARILVKNPSVLILDESTSAMDRDLEMFVMDLLSRLKRDKIILFISHRLHILKKYADYIYLIENGRVSHYGTHEEMMEGENMYADYWRAFM